MQNYWSPYILYDQLALSTAQRYDKKETKLRGVGCRPVNVQTPFPTTSCVLTENYTLPSPPANLPAALAEPSWSRDLVKEIARDIGAAVAAHIELMYPGAVEATNRNMLVSVRGTVHNEIMAALDGPSDEASIRARLADRKAWRRKHKAMWKKNREPASSPLPTIPEAV